MAKAKTKAAVKRKPVKAAPAVKAAKKTVATKPAKASAAKPARPAAAKPAGAVTSTKPPAIELKKSEPLSLPAAKRAEAPATKPVPVARKNTEAISSRADLPPADGFTLLVDGHFKNSFDDLKGAKAAASELKNRFPMLRVEIYDAAKKARLPA